MENDELSEQITYYSDSHCQNTYDELMSVKPLNQLGSAVRSGVTIGEAKMVDYDSEDE